MNYRCYLELQLWCRLCALIRHGLEDQAPRKYVVRLGFVLSDELNRARQWPTPAESARRVSPAMAARRQRSVHTGHAAPERAFITPAPARTQPHPVFTLPRPFFLAAAAAELSEPRRRRSQRQLAFTASPPRQRLH